MSTFCAIDFGTSNSAIATPDPHAGMALVALEADHRTMPTAVFYGLAPKGSDTPALSFGRAAVAAYVDGLDGRLMRSMKSILGSALIEQTTDVGAGRGVRYRDVVASFLAHLVEQAQRRTGTPIHRAVIGRPVFFVDDDPQRDAMAQSDLQAAARQVGLTDVHFQYEPIAAAFDYERRVDAEQLVLVADIGGGTSDFSVVRVGPKRIGRLDRKDDILANHGVHVAGTDFDRRIELDAILPEFGYGTLGPRVAGAAARPVPSPVYFDLATWHLINTVYNPARLAELRGMRRYYGNPAHHDRLMTVVTERLGHELAARAEQAKIELSSAGAASIDLQHIEYGLRAHLAQPQADKALSPDFERIVSAARLTVAQAQLQASRIDALYFTGGSTGSRVLTSRIAAEFPLAQIVHGDPFASVAVGLGVHARQLFRD